MLKYLYDLKRHYREAGYKSDKYEIEKIENSIHWLDVCIREVNKMPDSMIFVSVNEREGLMKHDVDIDNFNKII